MKICISAASGAGLATEVYGHFGSAPWFVIADTDKGAVEAVRNGNDHHAYGGCNPLAAVSGREVEALITGGIGLRALQLLQPSGVRAYRSAAPGTVSDVLEEFSRGRLQEIDPDSAYGHHGCH